jgi:hypothetical protein
MGTRLLDGLLIGLRVRREVPDIEHRPQQRKSGEVDACDGGCNRAGVCRIYPQADSFDRLRAGAVEIVMALR